MAQSRSTDTGGEEKTKGREKGVAKGHTFWKDQDRTEIPRW